MCVLRMSTEVQNTEFYCLQGCDSRLAPRGALYQTVCVPSQKAVVIVTLMTGLVEY